MYSLIIIKFAQYILIFKSFLNIIFNLFPQNNVSAIFNSSSSDLSDILEYYEELYVTSAIQKAKIIVNEAGSEAAAANGKIYYVYF